MSDRFEGGAYSGAKGYFNQGKGQPYPAHEYKSPAKTDAKRNTDVLIDLNDLNKPGVGPVDFDELSRGRVMPRMTTKTLGKVQGDID